MSTAIPQLGHGEGSWIVTSPNTGKVVELFERKNVELAETSGWRIETIGEYLTRIAREVRS
jgi:hypothetical protein